MRVTKVIKEYVETQVNAIYPLENTKEYSDVLTLINNTLEQLKKEYENKKLETFQKLIDEGKLPQGVIQKSWRGTDFTVFNTTLDKENSKHLTKVKEERKKAIQDILVSLELGATKTDLEIMLHELANK